MMEDLLRVEKKVSALTVEPTEELTLAIGKMAKGMVIRSDNFLSLRKRKDE